MRVIPVASAEARRRARAVELAIEIEARAQHQASIDAIGDRNARARWHFIRRIREKLTALYGVPGIGFILRLLDEGLVTRLRRQDALDKIEDADRVAIENAAFELAGILDSMPATRSEVAS